MNVLFIENAGHTSAGAFHALVVLADNLKKYGVNSFVALPDRADGCGLLEERQIPYIKLRECSYTQMISLKASVIEKIKMPFKDAKVKKAAKKLAEYVRENQIDIIHENTSACYIGRYVAELTGVKQVWHIREFLEEDFGCTLWNKKRAYRWFNEADKVLTISKAVYDKYAADIDNDKFVIVYDGVETAEYYCEQHEILQNENIKVLSVGRVCEGKGQHLLVKAAGLLYQQKGIKLFINIVGLCSEDAMENLLSIADEYCITDQVTIHGQVEDIKEQYRNNDVFCMCSRSEGFGLVTVEAMLSGCLVVGANSGGTKELICDGAGILFEPEDVTDLVKQLDYIVNHRAECKDIAIIGQKKAVEEFSAERNAKEVYKIYEGLVH